MAKCKTCGAEVMDGALFCTECGAPMTEDTANPFEPEARPASNPFAEFDGKEPKPEVASTLIFDDPDWKKAEKIEAQAEAAQAVADEAAKASQQAAYDAAPQQAKPTGFTAEMPKQEPTGFTAEMPKQEKPSVAEAFTAGMASGSTSNAAGGASSESDSVNWSGQSNYGKPQFNPDERPKPQAQQEAGFGQTGSQQTYTSYTYAEPEQTGQQSAGFGQAGAGNQGDQQTYGAWSAADERAQQGQSYNQSYNQGYGYNDPNQSIYAPDYENRPQGSDKIWAVLSYLFVIFWILAFFLGRRDANGKKSIYLTHHLNQSLIINVATIVIGWVSRIAPSVGILSLVVFVIAIMGIVSAVRGNTKPLPIIGDFKVFK